MALLLFSYAAETVRRQRAEDARPSRIIQWSAIKAAVADNLDDCDPAALDYALDLAWASVCAEADATHG